MHTKQGQFYRHGEVQNPPILQVMTEKLQELCHLKDKLQHVPLCMLLLY